MSDFVNLNEMGENIPKRTSNVFDITKATPGQVYTGEHPEETQQNSVNRIVPVQTGPTDFTNAAPMDTSVFVNTEKSAPTIDDDLMSALDKAVSKECDNITKFHDELEQAQYHEFLQEEQKIEEQKQDKEDDFAINGNTNISNNADDVIKDEVITEKPHEEIKMFDNIDMENLFDDEEDEEETKAEEPTVDSTLNDLKDQIKARTSTIKKTLDLSKFKITQKAVSAQKIMKLVIDKHQNVADWVMPGSNRSISMSGLSGPEILKLNPENTNRNRLNTFRDMYNIIYNHIIDGNKPEFETWLKQTKFADLQHIYFCLYKATFGGSNFVSYSCPECKKMFIKDVDFEDMVTYADEETKNKVKSILMKDSTSESNDSYESDLIQVSDCYALSIRTPSIWNVIIETASLSDAFLEKYADLIDVVAYIDGAYIIDAENESLTPVDTKPDPNNQAKTSARRIKTMYDIISTLNSEEYYALRSTINDMDKDSIKISYKIPGCKCKYCNADIAENTDVGPDAMLFTRHQLAAIGNM